MCVCVKVTNSDAWTSRDSRSGGAIVQGPMGSVIGSWLEGGGETSMVRVHPAAFCSSRHIHKRGTRPNWFRSAQPFIHSESKNRVSASAFAHMAGTSPLSGGR